jgi:hypothetical protein
MTFQPAGKFSTDAVYFGLAQNPPRNRGFGWSEVFARRLAAGISPTCLAPVLLDSRFS